MTDHERNIDSDIRGMSIRSFIAIIASTITIVGSVLGTYYNLKDTMEKNEIQTNDQINSINEKINKVELNQGNNTINIQKNFMSIEEIKARVSTLENKK